jgi:hypothetical protein
MTAKTKTAHRIAVDRGLQYLAAARREPVEKLHERYRSNRQFRRMIDAKQAMKGRKREAVQYVLEEYAKMLSPANAGAAQAETARHHRATEEAMRSAKVPFG